MIIDIILALAVVLAFVFGYRKGLIHAVLSLLGMVFGVLAALHFSYLASNWLAQHVNLPAQVLSIIAFIMVFGLVTGAFALIAYLLKKFLKVVQLNWLNRLAGGLLFVLVAVFLFSTALWFGAESNFVKEESIENSYTYDYIHPLSPFIVKTMGDVLPVLKDTYSMLDELFQQVAENQQLVPPPAE